MESNVARIEKYVKDKYPRTFKDKPLTVIENKDFYLIKINNDESPLILSKNI